MEWRYVTKSGDAFDTLARDLYGTEMLCGFLMSANTDYVDVVFFDAGVSLRVPPTPEYAPEYPRTPWA